MKVKIGRYPPWWTTSSAERWYITKRFGEGKFYDDYDPLLNKFDKAVMKFFDIWQSVLHATVNKIFAMQKRTIKVRIDDTDVWNMDETLSHIVLPMLQKIKESKHGYPIVDLDDVPDTMHGDPTNEGGGDEGLERWNWVLDEMIFAFSSAHTDWEEQFYSGEPDIQWIEREDGMHEMTTGPNDTFEIDWDGRQAYVDRMANGFRLFGKYYQGLWT